MITVLKSKIREVCVDSASVEYEGSITLSPELAAAAGLVPYEQVHVNSKYGKGRIITYVLIGPPGCGVHLNGGAANHFKPGETVHILAFEQTDSPGNPIIV